MEANLQIEVFLYKIKYLNMNHFILNNRKMIILQFFFRFKKEQIDVFLVDLIEFLNFRESMYKNLCENRLNRTITSKHFCVDCECNGCGCILTN